MNTIKIKSLVVALALFTTSVPTVAFAAIKAGSKCTVQNQTKVSEGKRYKCIKLGKKLVWDKGTTVPAIKPSASPSPTVKDISQNYGISSNLFSNANSCKMSDLTNRADVSNGFPRPNGMVAGKAKANVLVLPISFSDQVFGDSELDRLKKSLDKVSIFYNKVSLGRFSLTFEIPDNKKWISMNGTANSYNLVNTTHQQDNKAFVEKLFQQSDLSINFGNYDAVILETKPFASNSGAQAFPGVEFKTKNGVAKNVAIESGAHAGNPDIIAHELGHSLFGLEDLAIHLNSDTADPYSLQPTGPWDKMGTRDADNFFTWTKFLNGWIEDSEVACIVNQESFKVYLTESDLNKNKKKLLLIQDGPGKMIAAELRTPSVCYLDNNCFGLLLYNINTNIDHGAGPITVKRSVVSPGYSAIYSNYEFSVIDYDSRGILVSVKKYV